MQAIVDHMAEGEPHALARRSLHFEGVTRAGQEVEQEAHAIAYGVGYERVDHQKHERIDAILQRYGRDAHHNEAQHLAKECAMFRRERV